MKLIKLDAIDSTNSFIKELALKGQIDNLTAVISKFQSKGRGRNNNIWLDKPSNNLNFSLFKEFKNFKIDDKFFLNIISSVSVFSLLKKYDLKNLSVKWPNDIMTGNKKISGILIENNIRGQFINQSIIGVGININQLDFKTLPKATSLKIETGVSYNPEKLAVELQKILVSNFELFTQNPEKLLNNYNKLLFRKSKTIKYKSKIIKINEGDVVSVDQYGKFLIRDVNGIVKKFKENEIKLNY
jgi:BirA family biotin operon repressor/biotin-[acetyl-CoA-carboxylase] ligase